MDGLPEFAVRHWKVTAVGGDGKRTEVVTSSFSMASDKERLEAAALKPLAESDNPNDWLLAATAYHNFAAYNEALPLFEKLANRRPRQAFLQAVLAGYYSRAGLPDKAFA